MIYSIASLQFVFLSLGLLMVHLSVKVASSPGAVTPLVRLVVAHGVFLFLIPVLWILFANYVTQKKTPKISEGFIRGSGIIIIIAIGLLFVIPIVKLFF